jgi:integrin-linked kinase-associated serine/threonine phosphatase 2C
MKDAFKQAETRLKTSGIDYSNSGTCAVSVFIIKNMLYSCNLGDSRGVLYRVTNKEKLAIEVTYD